MGRNQGTARTNGHEPRVYELKRDRTMTTLMKFGGSLTPDKFQGLACIPDPEAFVNTLSAVEWATAARCIEIALRCVDTNLVDTGNVAIFDITVWVTLLKCTLAYSCRQGRTAKGRFRVPETGYHSFRQTTLSFW